MARMKEETELLTRQLILRITGFEVPTQSYFFWGSPKPGLGWDGVFWSHLVTGSIERESLCQFLSWLFQTVFSELRTLCNQTFFLQPNFFFFSPHESIFQSSVLSLSLSLHTHTHTFLCHSSVSFKFYII